MTAAERSALMGRIRGSDTGPERVLRAALWRRGLRYRVDARTPCGRADIVNASKRLAVFVDGCFWHGCPEHYVRPRTRDEFWKKKLFGNVARDIEQVRVLEGLGWQVIRCWEHDIYEDVDAVVARILSACDKKDRLSWRLFRVDSLDADGQHERRNLRELRGLEVDRAVEQLRHTRKWKRPAAGARSTRHH